MLRRVVKPASMRHWSQSILSLAKEQMVHSSIVSSYSASSTTPTSSKRHAHSDAVAPQREQIRESKSTTKLANHTIPATLLNAHPCCFTPRMLNDINYVIDLTQLAPAQHPAYLPLHCDTATSDFLTDCCSTYHQYVNTSHLKNAMLKPMLRYWYSHTEINGLLSVGQMFVLSTAQITALLQHATQAATTNDRHINASQYHRLLDIGAGDGNVTCKFESLFSDITATEVSTNMCKRLQQRKYTVHCTDTLLLPAIQSASHDVITLLNVLDRCDRPITLLKQILSLMQQHTLLMIAIVLPINASVEDSKTNTWNKPHESLASLPDKHRRDDGSATKSSTTAAKLCCMTFEQNLQHLVEHILQPLGFELLTVSRVPYVSQGDTVQPFYVLSDAVIVLRKSQKGEHSHIPTDQPISFVATE